MPEEPSDEKCPRAASLKFLPRGIVDHSAPAWGEATGKIREHIKIKQLRKPWPCSELVFPFRLRLMFLSILSG